MENFLRLKNGSYPSNEIAIEKKVKILKRNIAECKNCKKELVSKIKGFKKKYEAGEINYTNYEYLLNNYLEGKSLKFWEDYYDSYVKTASAHLKTFEEHYHVRPVPKKTRLPYANVAFIISIFIIGFFFMQNYTGAFTLTEEEKVMLIEVSSVYMTTAEKEGMLQKKFPDFDIKVDSETIQLSKEGMTVEIKGGKIYELQEAGFKDGVVYVNDVNIEKATVKIPTKTNKGIVSSQQVLSCKDEYFDKASFKCSDWENSGKLASVKDNFYTFTVDHFSAYYVNSTADADYTTIGACLAAINNTANNCIINGKNFYAVMPGSTVYNITPPDSSHGVVEFQANNITLDCNGTLIRSPLYTGSGILLFNAYNNITISNCSLSNFAIAIRYNAGSNNTKIIYNNITKTDTCLFLETGTLNANLSNNYCNATGYGISIMGSNNFIGHNTIYAGAEESGTGINILSFSSSFIVDNNTIFAGNIGIYLQLTNKTVVSNNDITAFNYGIGLVGISSFNNVTRNIITTSGSEYSSADLAMAEDTEMPSNNSIWLNHFYGLGVLGLDANSDPISPSNDTFCILISSNFSTAIQTQGNASNSTVGNTTFLGAPTFYPASNAIDGQWDALSTAWSSTPDDTMDQWLKVDLSSVANSNISKVIILWQNGSRSHNRSLEYSLNGNSWTILSVRNTTNLSVDAQYCDSCVPDVIDNININASYWRVFQEGGKGRLENYSLVIYEFMIFNQTKSEVYEGNFYNSNLNSSFIGRNDCGPANISIPQSNNTYAATINITWKKQSSIKPIEYTLEYSIDNGTNWTVITTVTDTNYLWDTSGMYAKNVSLRLTPSDMFYNATIAIVSNFDITETTPPIVTLLTPESGYNSSYGTVEFGFELTETYPSSCQLLGNWSSYRNNTLAGGVIKSFDSEGVVADDLNGDGYTDVIVSSGGGGFVNQFVSFLGMPSLSAIEGAISKIAWYEYDPISGALGGLFGAPYIEHIIIQGEEVNTTIRIKVVDLNKDNYKDIVYLTATEKIGWLRNSGDNLTFDNFTIQETGRTSLGVGSFGIGTVEALDLNNDTYLDLVTGNSSGFYFWINNQSSQPGFSRNTLFELSDSYGLTSASSTDIDSDGDTDLIATIWARCNMCGGGFWGGLCKALCALGGENSQILLLKNNGSNPPGFTTSVILLNNTVTKGLSTAKATDFDRDGDTDIAWCSLAAKYESSESNTMCFVGWAQNNNSDSNWPYYPIAWGNQSCSICLAVETADLNLDGYEDVIVSRLADLSLLNASDPDRVIGGGISWFANNGSNNNFTMYDIIRPTKASYGPAGIDVANFTYIRNSVIYQDNWTDVIISSVTGAGVVWYENSVRGGAEYDYIRFRQDRRVEVAIGSQEANFPTYVEMVDFDQDDDTDILFVNALGRNVVWWENDGNYVFTEHKVIEKTTSGDVPAFAQVKDLDNDGDNDILLTSADLIGLLASSGVGRSGTIAWFENSGNNLAFTEHTILTGNNTGTPIDSIGMDLDNDGDTDFASVLSLGDEVGWWEDINGSGTNFTKHTIANCTAADGPEDLEVIDFDFDGDYDVVFTSAGPFNSNPQLGTDFVSCSDPALNETYNCIDYKCGDRVAWWENKREVYNDTDHWVEHLIGNGSERLNGAFGLRVIDFDNDGDYDAVTSSVHLNPTALYWWENDGTNNAFTPHLISSFGTWAIEFEAVDFDKDGDIDIIQGTGLKDSVVFYENLGNGTSFVKHTIYQGTGGTIGSDAIIFPDYFDIDNDNDYDIAFAEIVQSKVYWYRNDQSFSVRQTSTGISEGGNSFVHSNISEGSYIWDVICNDTSQNSISASSNWSITIDPGVPVTILTNISNGTSIINATLPTNTGETITFNLNITEPTTALQSVWLEIYQNESKTSPLLFKGYLNRVSSKFYSANVNINASYTARRYNYTIYANDTMDNRDSLSGMLKVGNVAPSKPNLEYPAHGDTSETNRTLTFLWDASDQDGDELTYTLRTWCLKDDVSCLGNRSDDRVITGIKTTYYSLTYDLKNLYDDNYYYNWTVEVTDGIATNTSNVSEFGISSLISIGLARAAINFGALQTGVKVNTTDPAYNPLELRNDGNVIIDVNLSSTSLFSVGGFPSSTYQYKVAENRHFRNSFNLSQSITNWTNIPLANNTFLRFLNYTNRQDIALFHLLLDIPYAEPVGVKSSNITFTAWRAA